MADQQSSTETFSVTSERIDAPSWRTTVGWSSERGPAMGRTWVVQLPGVMSPDAVAAVEQTIRRAVHAAAEEERRRYGEQLDELHQGYSEAEAEHARKLALKTQIAEGATQQRDEQTARLGKVMADVERLTKERDELRAEGTSWCDHNTKQIEHITMLEDALRKTRASLATMTGLRDAARAGFDALTKEREAWLGEDTRWMQRVMGLEIELRRVAGERDALKAGKQTVNVDRLASNIRYNSTNQPLDLTRQDHARRFAWWLVNELKLDVAPTSEQEGKRVVAGVPLVGLSWVQDRLEELAKQLEAHAQAIRDDSDRTDGEAQAQESDDLEEQAKGVRGAAQHLACVFSRQPTSEKAGEVQTQDDTSRGLYGKYRVERTDGSSRHGGKHAECRYFVLDVTHDPFAVPALRAYADACQSKYAELAKDLRTMLAGVELATCSCPICDRNYSAAPNSSTCGRKAGEVTP